MQEFWNFVFDNINVDPAKLRLKYHGQSMDFDVDLAIVQIECRKRFGKKLAATLAAHPEWLFPSTLAGEQSTSDRLAAYHAELARGADTMADLTAGLGIDALHMSGQARHVYAVEIDPAKADALKYNFVDSTVSVICQDCREWILEAPHCGCMFIDPARRAADGGRLYALEQCQPDVAAMMPALSAVTDRLIVKLSPMLDISHTFSQLPQAHTIICLGTPTECKELIAIVDFRQPERERHIEAVTLMPGGERSTVAFTQEGESAIDMTPLVGSPTEGAWLYDPYPAVMKAAPYRTLCARYRVKMISANTHLFVSDHEVQNFPGQRLLIDHVIPFASKIIKRLKSSFPKISVITRNFDMPADKLRQKLGVTDGGTHRLYAVTLQTGQKCMLIAH